MPVESDMSNYVIRRDPTQDDFFRKLIKNDYTMYRNRITVRPNVLAKEVLDNAGDKGRYYDANKRTHQVDLFSLKDSFAHYPHNM